MGLPGVSLVVQDGNLNVLQGTNEHTPLLMGVCTLGTPATLYTFGDAATAQATLGYGKLVELVSYVFAIGGGPVQVMPIDPSTGVGALGAVTHTGTGAGTMTVSSAPHQAIKVVLTISGTLNTAAATYQVGTGPISAPVILPTGHMYFVPGTYCTITWPTHNYNANESYVFNTDGTYTYAANGSGGSDASPTQVSSPIDNYNAQIAITTAGALGTAQFTYSLDNGEANLGGGGSVSAPVLSAGSGVYAIPNSGVVITLSGTQTAGDKFTFGTASAFYSSTSLGLALTALETTYLNALQSSLVAVANYMPVSAASAVTQAGTLETAASALFNSGIYLRFMNEFPSVGSIFVSTGTFTIDVADTDSVLEAAAVSLADAHVIACAGDALITSPFTGLTLRRNTLWTIIARAASIEASRNPGDVSLGGVTGVVYLFRDEQKTQGLDAARFNTLRTFPGEPGFYITDFHTLALSSSDYASGMNARVIDLGCKIARSEALPLVNNKVPTTTRNSVSGVITEQRAQQIEARIDSALEAEMVDTSPADAVAAAVVVSRTHQISVDGQLVLSVAIQPFFYSRTVTVTIGLSVRA